MSSGGTPYIGSKISLISKAKIRYEGFLYTIDTEESTVTLAKVKSFGTEDRKAPNRVPERNEIYEYIVFRGSDIDDLNVAEGPQNASGSQMADDPAIVQTGNTHSNMYQHPMQMNTPFAPQNYGPFGGMPPYGYPMGFRPQGNMPLSSVIGPGSMTDRNQRSSSFDQYRRSPSPPSAGVVGHRYQPKEKQERSRTPDGSRTVARPGESHRGYESQTSAAKPQREQRSSQRQRDSEQNRERSSDHTSRKHTSDHDHQRQFHRESEESKEQSRSRDRDLPKDKSRDSSKGSRKQAEAKDSDGGKVSESSKSKTEGRDKGKQKRTDNEVPKKSKDVESSKEVKKETSKDSNREGHDSVRGNHRGRGRGRARGRGNFNKTRFDKDFDFERANAKFNKEEVERELLSALKKNVSLKEEDDVIIENDGPKDLENEEPEGEVNGDDIYYDKSKSFFDQISCDAGGPSSDGFSKRKERALNAETFGIVPRNYRGRPYRGRGGRGSRGRGFGRGGPAGRRGRGGSRTWVNYEFDFEAAGIRQGSNSNKSGGS